MYYTLGTAAKACGKSKPTILNAIKRGRLSATRDDIGNWKIDPAELCRVYPYGLNSNEPEQEAAPPLFEKEAEIRELKIRLQALEELKDRIEREVEELRVDRDAWRHQATAVLPPPDKNPPLQAVEVIEPEPVAAIQQQDTPGQQRTWLSFFFPWVR